MVSGLILSSGYPPEDQHQGGVRVVEGQPGCLHTAPPPASSVGPVPHPAPSSAGCSQLSPAHLARGLLTGFHVRVLGPPRCSPRRTQAAAGISFPGLGDLGRGKRPRRRNDRGQGTSICLLPTVLRRGGGTGRHTHRPGHGYLHIPAP